MLIQALRSAAGWILHLVRQQLQLLTDPLTLIGDGRTAEPVNSAEPGAPQRAADSAARIREHA